MPPFPISTNTFTNTLARWMQHESPHRAGRALTHSQTRRAIARKQARREIQAKSRRYNRYH
jgi:hypothetical protein